MVKNPVKLKNEFIVISISVYSFSVIICHESFGSKITFVPNWGNLFSTQIHVINPIKSNLCIVNEQDHENIKYGYIMYYDSLVFDSYKIFHQLRVRC